LKIFHANSSPEYLSLLANIDLAVSVLPIKNKDHAYCPANCALGLKFMIFKYNASKSSSFLMN
jgi:hypothetical protein